MAHEYLERYLTTVFLPEVIRQLLELKRWLIASHGAVDFTKNAWIRAINFNEADLVTCFANGFGYARWLEKALEYYIVEMRHQIWLLAVCNFIIGTAEYPARKESDAVPR